MGTGQILSIQNASEVRVRGADDQIRTLKVGDTLRPGDTLLAPDQVTVELDAGADAILSLPGGANATLTADMFEAARAAPGQAPVIDESVQELVESILTGEDFEEQLEATAAGPAAGGAEGEGSSFIRLQRIQEGTEPAVLNSPQAGAASGPAIVETQEQLPPAAQADLVAVDEDASIVIDVLANDSDPNGEPLQIIGWTQPEHGTVTQDPATGLPLYTPDPNYHGPDAFTYTIADPAGNTSTATASITVNPVNDAPVAQPDSGSGPEDSAITVAVLDNDTDLEGDTLTVTLIDGQAVVAGDSVPVAHGSASLNADGTITFTPDENYSGPVSFDYTISDGAGGLDTGTVSLTVTPVNDAPAAGDDAFVTNEDVPLAISAAAMLSNDSDVEGAGLSITGFTQPAHGSLASDGSGGFIYTPEADYHGEDSFTYTVSDGAGGTDSATVALRVLPLNDGPDALNDALATNEDTALLIGAGELLANDTDIDGDTLIITGFTQPSHGTLTDNGNGSFIYTPAPNYHGPDSFNYTVGDGQGGSDSAVVNLVVNPVNDPPVALGNSASTIEDTPVVISAAELLSNDSDIDGDSLTITGFSQPAHGSVVDNGNGTFTYTPAPGYSGGDSFSYTVSDGHGGFDSALVGLSVAPVDDLAEVFDASSGQVYEEALVPAGNVDEPASPSATATGSGVVTDADGPLPLLSLTGPANGAFSSGGVPIIWSGSGTAGDPLIGTAGSAVVAAVWITSVVATGAGQYSYSYQFDLSGPVDHLPTEQGEESLPMDFDVIANGNPLADTGTLSIAIEDDRPVIAGTQSVALDYTTTQGPATAELGISYGADTASPAAVQLNLSEGHAVVDANSGNPMTSDGVDLYWYGDGAGGWFAATSPTAAPVIEVSLQPGADQYSVDLVGSLDGASTTVSTPLTTAGELHGGNTPSVSFDVDQDGDGGFDAYLNVTGSAAGVASTVNVSANSMGVGQGQSINPGDRLQIEYRDSTSGELIPTYEATVGIYVTGSHTASGSWTALSGGVNGTVVDSGSFTSGNGGSIAIDPDAPFDTLVFSADEGSNYGVDSIQLVGESVIPGVTQQIDLGFTATDADGDTALGTLSMTFAEQDVTVQSKLDATETGLSGGDDALDVLSSDTLVWQPSDRGEPGSPQVDTIANFTPGEHVLDLGDLVQGDSADALTSYLHFDVDGADTVIHVSSSGGFADGFDLGLVDHQIILEGFDLTLAGTLGSDLHIIQDLLDNGSLVVD